MTSHARHVRVCFVLSFQNVHNININVDVCTSVVQWIQDALNMRQEAVASLPWRWPQEAGAAVNQLWQVNFPQGIEYTVTIRWRVQNVISTSKGVLLLEHFGLKYPITFRWDNRGYCLPNRLFLEPENRAALGSVDKECYNIRISLYLSYLITHMIHHVTIAHIYQYSSPKEE